MSENLTIEQIDYHRNGVAGEGFAVILFRDRDRDNAQMVATIGFKYVEEIDDHVPDPITCRVLDVATLAEGEIRFGWNSWRGDHYGYTLAPIVQAWSDKRHERLMAEIAAGSTPKPEVFILGEEQQ